MAAPPAPPVGRGHRLPPGDRRTTSSPAPGSGGRARSTTTLAAWTSPMIPDDPAASCGCSTTSARPTRTASSWPSRRRSADRTGRRRVHRGVPARGPCGSSGCCSCMPDDTGARARPGAPRKRSCRRPDEAATLATCTDAAQPISNGLYARYGIVPRVPLLELVGRPDRDGHMPGCRAGSARCPFAISGGRGEARPRRLDDELAALDRETARLRASAGPRLSWPRAGRRRLPLSRRRRPGRRLRLHVGGGPGRADRGSRTRRCCRRSIGHLLRTVAPPGRFSALDAGRGRARR